MSFNVINLDIALYFEGTTTRAAYNWIQLGNAHKMHILNLIIDENFHFEDY